MPPGDDLGWFVELIRNDEQRAQPPWRSVGSFSRLGESFSGALSGGVHLGVNQSIKFLFFASREWRAQIPRRSPAFHELRETLLLLGAEKLIRPVVLDDDQRAAFIGGQLRRQRVQCGPGRFCQGLSRTRHGTIHQVTLHGQFLDNGYIGHNTVLFHRKVGRDKPIAKRENTRIVSDRLSTAPRRGSGLDGRFRRRDADGGNRDGLAPRKVANDWGENRLKHFLPFKRPVSTL
jgi:hypothetical protein